MRFSVIGQYFTTIRSEASFHGLQIILSSDQYLTVWTLNICPYFLLPGSIRNLFTRMADTNTDNPEYQTERRHYSCNNWYYKSLLPSHILTHFSSGDSQVSEEGSGVPAEVSPGSRWRNIHRVCISQAWQVNIRYTSITISWYFPWTDIIPISDISFLKVMQNANYFWSQNQNCKHQN